MALALYQKYRPLTLAQVFGHDKVKADLLAWAKADKIPSCLHFFGDTGVGKTTLAYIMAKTNGCAERTPEGHPCCKCQACLDVQNNQWKIVTYRNCVYMSASDVRALGDVVAQGGSLFSERCTVIIDEIQALSGAAQTAMLEFLEHEWIKTKFVLVSNGKVEKALLSRTVPCPLKVPETKTVLQYLLAVCRAEKVVIEEDKANILGMVAARTSGSFRAAAGYLDRIIHGDLWTLEGAEAELDLYTEDKLDSIVLKILDGDPALLSRGAIGEQRWTSDFIGDLIYRLQLGHRKSLGAELEVFLDPPARAMATRGQTVIEHTLRRLLEIRKLWGPEQRHITAYIGLLVGENKARQPVVPKAPLPLPRAPRVPRQSTL